MADDGMLLNFDLGDVSLKPQVKFQGGRWRDRVKAQRNEKKGRQEKRSASPDANAPLQEKSNTAVKPRREARDDDSEIEERPAKRQRADPPRASSYQTGKLPPGSIVISGRRDLSQFSSGQVTSRLFSSNPTPKTVFDDPKNAKAEEDAEPSNAPLSAEAANFIALGVSRRLALTLSTKFLLKAPTAIQAKVIPQLIKDDNDAFVQAQTGSGKTLAYLLPILQRMLAIEGQVHRDSGLFAIVLAPTRELCRQIDIVLTKLLPPWLVSTTVIGGESKKSEKSRLRKGVNILIATPGRLSDHLENTKVLDVGTVRWLVLDEGDRLMEMGFESELRTIVGRIRTGQLANATKNGVSLEALPKRRVTVLCSATMKMNVQKLGEISLDDAVHITADEEEEQEGQTQTTFSAPAQLKQSYVIVPAKLRLVSLIALLKATFLRRGSVMKAIVFMSCADSVDFHFDLLRAPAAADEKPSVPPSLTANTAAPAAYVTSTANPTVMIHKLHGSLPQPVRTSTLAAFTTCTDPCVLITTDISSRGLDVPSVDVVIEYDPAFSVDDHTHRIGRTARAGRPGKAVLFLMPGCEEGYAGLLNSNLNTSSTPQMYDTILQKGLSVGMDFPTKTDATPLAADNKSHLARAENLQLHLEQRLLTPSSATLLDQARRGFRSHIRAYATHVREERVHFDIKELHLGHTAKSYGLREAPSGVGRGNHGTKRTFVKKSGGKTGGDGAKSGGPAGDDGDLERRMKIKMNAVMDAAGEFNIG